MDYLLQNVLPALRREIPGVRVLIVGRDPPPDVLAAAGPDIEVTGASGQEGKDVVVEKAVEKLKAAQ